MATDSELLGTQILNIMRCRRLRLYILRNTQLQAWLPRVQTSHHLFTNSPVKTLIFKTLTTSPSVTHHLLNTTLSAPLTVPAFRRLLHVHLLSRRVTRSRPGVNVHYHLKSRLRISRLVAGSPRRIMPVYRRLHAPQKPQGRPLEALDRLTS